jgi:hypothetical protein
MRLLLRLRRLRCAGSGASPAADSRSSSNNSALAHRCSHPAAVLRQAMR